MLYCLHQELRSGILAKLEEATVAEQGCQRVAQEVAALQKEAEQEEEANGRLLAELNRLKVFILPRAAFFFFADFLEISDGLEMNTINATNNCSCTED